MSSKTTNLPGSKRSFTCKTYIIILFSNRTCAKPGDSLVFYNQLVGINRHSPSMLPGCLTRGINIARERFIKRTMYKIAIPYTICEHNDYPFLRVLRLAPNDKLRTHSIPTCLAATYLNYLYIYLLIQAYSA